MEEQINMDLEQIIDNTITWAMKYLGKKDYAFKCLGFVNHALGYSNGIEIFYGYNKEYLIYTRE